MIGGFAMNIYTTQLRKLFCRTDVKWILLAFTVLPFGIAALIFAESGIVQIGNSVFTAMGYSSVVVGLLNSLLLISVTVALATTSLVSKEIDTGLDGMYVTKVRARGQILLSKMLALDVLCATIFLVLLLSSLAGFCVFLMNSSYGMKAIATTNFEETFTLVYTILGSFFESLVMVRVFTLVSLLFKHSKALVFSYMTVVGFKLLGNIEVLQRWIPSFLGAGTHLYEYKGAELALNGVTSLGILIGYAVILSLVNYVLYRNMDLSR